MATMNEEFLQERYKDLEKENELYKVLLMLLIARRKSRC